MSNDGLFLVRMLEPTGSLPNFVWVLVPWNDGLVWAQAGCGISTCLEALVDKICCQRSSTEIRVWPQDAFRVPFPVAQTCPDCAVSIATAVLDLVCVPPNEGMKALFSVASDIVMGVSGWSRHDIFGHVVWHAA